MGVLNVTPDSFHPASRTPDVGAVGDRARRMIGEGADILDVGGESTRPGAAPVSEAEERARVIPAIEALRAKLPDAIVSIDTYKAEVARAAVAAGASIINDVSGGTMDAAMPEAAAETGATVIVGHIRGTPETMRNAPEYRDVVRDVTDELAARLEAFRAAGVAEDRLWVDPGIGFGKRAGASRALLLGLGGLARLGCPIVVGVSRKSFLGVSLRQAGLPDESSDGRLEASLAGAVLAADRGAALLRTHDVGPTRRALALLEEPLGTER